ncbi:hypothetical protein E2C01_051620 [Portunus trituberculatus]|uniref:Uncharacterized protein n=1 Tax=Portunus trituberculatus TaxID=210409 RepID=A0A5B7GJU6_PORTR|nr:hypothetical protein [Portunus trituberculatus]
MKERIEFRANLVILSHRIEEKREKETKPKGENTASKYTLSGGSGQEDDKEEEEEQHTLAPTFD